MANNVGSIGNLPGTSQPAGATIPQHVLLVDTNGSPVVIAGSTVATAAGIQYQTGTSTNAPTGTVIMALAGGGSVVTLECSTSAPSSGANGLFVRPVLGGLQTYAASTTGQSTATTIVSSNAASRAFVYAYSLISTIVGGGSSMLWGFYDGATLKWGGGLAAPSGGMSGANLAVSPPAYLFATSTGQALTFNFASSNAGVSLSVAYWVST